MILIGADLASTSGFCWGRPQQTPATAAFTAPVCGDDYGQFGVFWWVTINRLLDHVQADRQPEERLVLAYEAPFNMQARYSKTEGRMIGGTTIATTRKLQGLGMLLETICRLHVANPEVCEVNVKTIKKKLGGSGAAEKVVLVQAARRAGIILPDGKEAKDAADGLGAWLVALDHYAPEYRDHWERRIRGADIKP